MFGMRRSLYVIFQLDEARRYIDDGRLERLRLALLLLDNAVEIQLGRQVASDLAFEKHKERIREEFRQIPEARRDSFVHSYLAWTPLTSSQRRKIRKFFNEKVDYMVGRTHRIDARLAEPLKYLHQYRNEAYHRAKVRKDTIRTAALLLFEVNCQLLLSLPETGSSYNSGEDYSWLKERFGIEPIRLMGSRPLLAQIVNELRSELVPNDQIVASALTEHIESRVEDFNVGLDSIASDIACPDKERAFKCCQYFAETGNSNFEPSVIDAYKPQYTLNFIAELKNQVSEISRANNRLDAFSAFSRLERALEPVEQIVEKLGMAVDEWIQLQIDMARGK